MNNNLMHEYTCINQYCICYIYSKRGATANNHISKNQPNIDLSEQYRISDHIVEIVCLRKLKGNKNYTEIAMQTNHLIYLLYWYFTNTISLFINHFKAPYWSFFRYFLVHHSHLVRLIFNSIQLHRQYHSRFIFQLLIFIADSGKLHLAGTSGYTDAERTIFLCQGLHIVRFNSHLQSF